MLLDLTLLPEDLAQDPFAPGCLAPRSLSPLGAALLRYHLCRPRAPRTAARITQGQFRDA
jgi:hypothetical protein